MFRKISLILLVITVFATFSCSEFKKAQKSGDPRYKYQMAEKCYQKQDYQHAMQLLDELLIYYRGSDTSEKVSYYYAFCYYGMGDYIQAGYYFLKFTNTFPTSQYSEECLYMSAYCQYLFAPEYSLDQSISLDAIKQFQLFIDQYPKSKRVEDCNKLIDELRAKQEQKSYESAQLYLDTESYKAAVVAFKNLLKDFPGTKFREQAYFYILKSSYLYAVQSVQNKKLGRLNLAVDAYNAFTTIFPESTYMKDAKSIYKNINKEIEKINPKKS
jgi:outer membrane protein assembly factor BamD